MNFFDEEEIMRSYIESERYEAVQEAILENSKKMAIRMLKAGNIPLEDIAYYVDLPLDVVEELKIEAMHLA